MPAVGCLPPRRHLMTSVERWLAARVLPVGCHPLSLAETLGTMPCWQAPVMGSPHQPVHTAAAGSTVHFRPPAETASRELAVGRTVMGTLRRSGLVFGRSVSRGPPKRLHTRSWRRLLCAPSLPSANQTGSDAGGQGLRALYHIDERAPEPKLEDT
eukprot:10250526-Ditylum_brightwellii.AAC.1